MNMRRMTSRTWLLLYLVVAGIACAPALGGTQAPASAPRPAAPYRILVTNDDGVRAPGMLAVALALQSLGEVTIVAPAENQSGKGHSITIAEPIFRDEVTLAGGLRAIGLAATPVSSVKVALGNIVRPRPDLVVSGINRGYNLGLSAYLSGTVGAAREATSRGIPAIAASLATPASSDYTAAADATLRVARRVKENGLPEGIFLNVNIPAGTLQTWKGFMITTQAMSAGGVERFDERKHPNGRTYYWNVYQEGLKEAKGTDAWAVEEGYVSITPLKVGEYDAQAAARLAALIPAR
jgi:5'-nucleotidase